MTFMTIKQDRSSQIIQIDRYRMHVREAVAGRCDNLVIQTANLSVRIVVHCTNRIHPLSAPVFLPEAVEKAVLRGAAQEGD